MKPHADRLYRAVLLSALVAPCLLPVHAFSQATTEQSAATNAEPAEEPLDFAALPRDGHAIFSRQPNEAEIRAFAESGGKMVICARTEAEMEKLDFDERALVESLGMEFVLIPMRGSALSFDYADQLGNAVEHADGSALLHCGSGSRMKALYAVYESKHEGLGKDEVVAAALERGMGESMVKYIERTLMQTPKRVMDSVMPTRMIEDIHTLVSFGTRHTLSETENNRHGIGGARRWVHKQFSDAIADSGKIGDEKPFVQLDRHNVDSDGRRILEPVEVTNVLCTIPGSMPEARSRRYYVLAHLDSRASDVMDSTIDAPGANDDGSGVAALIELARVLAKEHLDATVVLMATTGEEQGLVGARLHAQQNAEGIAGVLNNDMIGDPTGPNGREDRDHVRVFSQGIPSELLTMDGDDLKAALKQMRTYGGESDNTSRQLARYIYDVADLHKTAVQPMLVMRPDRFLRGGDHTPFDEMGLPAIRFCEVHESYDRQHQDVRTEDGVSYGDRAEHVDAEYLANVTRLNAATLVHLANAPSVPTNARIIVADLANDTTLRWDACPETDVAGYEIVWRETTSATWDHAQDVGNVTEGTVDLSKDNYFFGVRAYDKEGYRSPVAFPGAAKE
ncbi:MAG: M20/M25/M40 family metallo-hydrolase [Phycisphaerales bacterium]|nr:M20/M25/M40 family metallo-hydrolase [Phycisphaerales bacterium]